MKIRRFFPVVMAALTGCMVFADFVDLRDGRRIEGLILAENEDSIEIEVGKNETGTIRQILKIHSSEISSWVADQEGRITREKGSEVKRLAGTDYVKRLLEEGVKEIETENYDKGIQKFGEAADIATQNADKLEPEDRVEAMRIRAHALRLQLAALEGKSESLEIKTDGVEDQLKEQQKKLEQDIEDFKKDKEDFQQENADKSIQLGERHKQNDLALREEELIRRQLIMKERSASIEKALGEFEREQMKTTTQIKVVEEQVDQAEDDVKKAERAVGRR